jgi:hypothetical protein
LTTTGMIGFLGDIRAIPRRGPTPRSGGEGGRESRSVVPRPNCRIARGDTPPL